ncbi:hypothetical protein O6D21_21255, partial [Cronobacter sakazakii]|uniref:hypothetical protein n=1 Tax=Cronobacter sakazakii TaxID=28141 RepID=UPI0022B2BCB1
GRSPALPENRAVVLRIEPLRVSPHSGIHPSPGVKGTASGGLTATAPEPFAVGELQCFGAAISAGDSLAWVNEGQGRSYMGEGSLREPSPIWQGNGGEPSRIKIGTLKGTPDFFLDGSAAVRECGEKDSQYVNITGWIRAVQI